MEQSLGVYKAIAKVQSLLAKEGISKDHRNSQQGYSFRGIDDAYNTLAPLLSANGLCILPNVLERSQTKEITKSGSTLFYTCVKTRFTFICVEDGSCHDVETYGEAMDSADKSTNKAMSAAYKYMCFQVFCIPTKGDNDADATTHNLSAKKQEQKQEPAKEYVLSTNDIAAIDSCLDENELISICGGLTKALGNEYKRAIIKEFNRRNKEIQKETVPAPTEEQNEIK